MDGLLPVDRMDDLSMNRPYDRSYGLIDPQSGQPVGAALSIDRHTDRLVGSAHRLVNQSDRPTYVPLDQSDRLAHRLTRWIGLLTCRPVRSAHGVDPSPAHGLSSEVTWLCQPIGRWPLFHLKGSVWIHSSLNARLVDYEVVVCLTYIVHN